jgi:hypothetical protein
MLSLKEGFNGDDMAANKKQIRAAFRTAVFERDRYRCIMCGKPGKDRQGGDGHHKFHHGISEDKLVLLDAHHITDRNELPNGGYVPENGATLCGSETDGCHSLAEAYHRKSLEEDCPVACVHGFSPDDLYDKIGSTREEAEAASLKLG